MSNFNSTNTHILATHMQAGNNLRMLLLHICESGRHEYVIGSYFTSVWEPIAGCYEYAWDWGHYFSDGYSNDGSGIVSAVDYWKQVIEEEEHV